MNVALLKAAFLEMRDRGKTLIFSTHQMDMVEELCDAIAIIDAGRLVASGATRDVKRSTGKQVVRLATDGDPDLPWLADIEGVAVVRPGRDYTRARGPRGHRPGGDPPGRPRPRRAGHPASRSPTPRSSRSSSSGSGESTREDVSLAGVEDGAGRRPAPRDEPRRPTDEPVA